MSSFASLVRHLEDLLFSFFSVCTHFILIILLSVSRMWIPGEALLFFVWGLFYPVTFLGGAGGGQLKHLQCVGF